MALKGFLLALATAPLASAETILGAYMLHRHGDRTPKAYKPVNLTALGAEQVYRSGKYYRQRYVESEADFKIFGLSSDIAIPSQITVQAPIDPVLQNSAQAFLQGLYPPVGTLGVQELANGTEVSNPFDGYQYIPVNTEAASNDHSENNIWLQAGSNCTDALISSNQYLTSNEYNKVLDESHDLYQSILPVINGTFDEGEASFRNGYAIWDLLNVALIHNKTIPSSNLLTDSTMMTLKTLADLQQWNYAYNSSSEIRAIAGKVLAGQITTHFSAVVAKTAGRPRLGVQFGAYATFFSFFGLASLDNVSEDFKGIVNYASSMSLELFTDKDVDAETWPAEDDIKVRFLFANGTASSGNEPQVFPLFGSNDNELSWKDFEKSMGSFAVASEEDWCNACRVTTGECAAFVDNDDDDDAINSSNDHHDGDKHSGMEPGVAAGIGIAGTAGAFILFFLALHLFGFRLSKKTSPNASGPKSPA